MLRVASRLVPASNWSQRSLSSLPVSRERDAKRKPLDEVLGAPQPKNEVAVQEESNKGVAGVPEEHQAGRTARIFIPARAATQSGWNNTKAWKIELDNRGRWSNNLIGWSSSGDPLSNISMQLKFGSKEEAVAFCQKNNWDFVVEEPQERKIEGKSYAANYSWNKRCRSSTKMNVQPSQYGHFGPRSDMTATVQRILDENAQLIRVISEDAQKGKAEEQLRRQQLLHRNLVYLARFADQGLISQLMDPERASEPASTMNGATAPPQMEPTAPHPPPQHMAPPTSIGSAPHAPPPVTSHAIPTPVSTHLPPTVTHATAPVPSVAASAAPLPQHQAPPTSTPYAPPPSGAPVGHGGYPPTGHPQQMHHPAYQYYPPHAGYYPPPQAPPHPGYPPYDPAMAYASYPPPQQGQQRQ